MSRILKYFFASYLKSSLKRHFYLQRFNGCARMQNLRSPKNLKLTNVKYYLSRHHFKALLDENIGAVKWLAANDLYFFLLKMGQSRPLFGLFSVFFEQNNFYMKSMWKMSKCTSNIRRRDSNPQPCEYESSPITIRPGL